MWYERLTNFLSSIGLNRLKSDESVFTGTFEGCHVYLAIYVDDGLIMCESANVLNRVITLIKHEFPIKVSKPSTFVGLEIARLGERGPIHLHQGFYIDALAQKYNLPESKRPTVPLHPQVELWKGPPTPDPSLPYRELIGSLLYLVKGTRPDIAFAVSRLARFMTCYDESHYKAALNVLLYVQATSRLGLFYEGKGTKLKGFTDADHANDKVDRKSITGVLFQIGESTVTWISKKQKCVALSSTESEYMALSEGSREAVWIRNLLEELNHGKEPTPIYLDNQSAIRLASNAEMHQRTKHIDYKYHCVRDFIKKKLVTVHYIKTEEQTADFLTKALPRAKFDVCVQQSNMIDLPAEFWTTKEEESVQGGKQGKFKAFMVRGKSKGKGKKTPSKSSEAGPAPPPN